jgi:hypothetical protein
MAENKRSPQNIRQGNDSIGGAPMLARVVGHLDGTFMGTLKVNLLRYQGNNPADDQQMFYVRAAPPFFGSTAYEYQGMNPTDYNDVQKSYGWWAVPPDVGVTVIVVFIDGDPSQGYWLGCVPPRFANHMVPGIAASPNVLLSEADKKKYNTKQPLPGAEPNRLLNKEVGSYELDKLKRPVHPFADHLLEQGILEDDIRGTTTSSARREAPSSVFGVSTPGPLDKRPGSKRGKIGTSQTQTNNTVPVSRLGGSQFVMDDGDDRYQRKAPAGKLGQGNAYADILNGEKGDPTIPKDELIRIRTRTGHQLLMHNSEDLIYIGNSRGTTWIEMTSNGKIDIYAEDSVSVHTKTDFNFRADRDINIEAGRNINMKATAQYSEGKIQDAKEYESGRIQIESAFNTNILIGANGKIETRTYKDADEKDVDGQLDINVKGDGKIAVGTGLEPHNFALNTTGNNAFTAGAATDILSGGNHTETAAQIHMNGPQAATAATALTIADLVTHQVVETDGTQEWAKTKYIKTEPLESIMKRVPMHEPWVLHENLAPELQSPESTDRELTGE